MRPEPDGRPAVSPAAAAAVAHEVRAAYALLHARLDALQAATEAAVAQYYAESEDPAPAGVRLQDVERVVDEAVRSAFKFVLPAYAPVCSLDGPGIADGCVRPGRRYDYQLVCEPHRAALNTLRSRATVLDVAHLQVAVTWVHATTAAPAPGPAVTVERLEYSEDECSRDYAAFPLFGSPEALRWRNEAAASNPHSAPINYDEPRVAAYRITFTTPAEVADGVGAPPLALAVMVNGVHIGGSPFPLALRAAPVFRPGPGYALSAKDTVATASKAAKASGGPRGTAAAPVPWPCTVLGPALEAGVVQRVRLVNTDNVLVGLAPATIDPAAQDNHKACGWYFGTDGCKLYSQNAGDGDGARRVPTVYGRLGRGATVGVLLEATGQVHILTEGSDRYQVHVYDVPMPAPYVLVVLLKPDGVVSLE